MDAMQTTLLYTIADLATLDGHYELDRGELVVVNPPMPLQGAVTVQLIVALNAWVTPRGLGRVYAETGYHLESDPDTLRGPDVSFVRAERVAGQSPAAYYPGGPDICVEIVSPSDRAGKMWHKVGQYLDAGSALVWLIDPSHERATICRADGSVQVLGPEDDLDGEAVLPGFHHPLADLFR